MATKKRPSSSPPSSSGPAWQVILEEIKSQNRSTIEAVESSRAVLEQRIDRLDQESRARDGTLELAIRQLRADVRRIEGKVDRLAPLEERVAALERRA